VSVTEEVERVGISKLDLFARFDGELVRSMPHGRRLWPLSSKSAGANRRLFIAMMDTPGMKEKFPRARLAIRILEVASGRGLFEDLVWETFMKEYERKLKADEESESVDETAAT
jgi:hypothetical protein